MIIGRALVELDNGDVVNALIVASQHPRTVGKKFAAYWEWNVSAHENTSRLVALELVEGA